MEGKARQARLELIERAGAARTYSRFSVAQKRKNHLAVVSS